jgi:hypothetical protein
MKCKVLVKGNLIPVADVPRGQPILRTAEQWHMRSVWVHQGYIIRFLLTFIPTFFATWFLMELLVTGTFGGRFWLTAVTYAIGFPIVYMGMEGYFSLKEVSRTHYSGLFEYGLQSRIFGNDRCFFIPYTEILDFQVKKKWFVTRIELSIKDMKKPLKLDGIPPILGEMGLVELRKRIIPEWDPAEAPKLVVYDEH